MVRCRHLSSMLMGRLASSFGLPQALSYQILTMVDGEISCCLMGFLDVRRDFRRFSLHQEILPLNI